MVRLKEKAANWRKWQGVAFQFHSGTIKRMDAMAYKVLQKSFNSIVVRLKVASETVKRQIETPFQFHSGTIKRR